MSEDVKPYGAPATLADEPTVEELRALIARTGLSQRRAAEAIEVSERMMRYYANGKERIPRSVLYALRYLASQVPQIAGSGTWGELPPGELYFICPAGGSVADLHIATHSTAVAREALAGKRAEGQPHEVWHAKRIQLEA